MIMIKKLTTVFVFLCIAVSNSVLAADTNQKLFVNLTSDEINRAAMAIKFSTKVLTQKKIPVTIFLTVEGVRIADKSIPELRYINGKSLKEMLSGFMKQGGRVIICGMCMKNVGGIKRNEVIEGVQFSGAIPALFEDGTTVLSYQPNKSFQPIADASAEFRRYTDQETNYINKQGYSQTFIAKSLHRPTRTTKTPLI